tara:strand:- start:756 stop:1676 length:921 start_codon:yes stop_codon:yes gene_type:complete
MSYSFLRESKLYIEYSGAKYRIYTTSAISFNQTFAEDSYSVKTLHDQSKMFEGSIINKANPASFSFEVPLTIEKDESIMLDLALDLVATAESDIEDQQLKSFDIYVQTGSSTFKLEGAVITSASMDFVPQNPITLRVEGEGKKLTRAGDESFNLGTIQSESSTRTPLLVYPTISVDSLNMNNILSANILIQNSIEWTPYETLTASLAVTNSSNAMFPNKYTLGNRIVSGEIRQYQTDNNVTQFDDFSTSANLAITAKNVSGDANFLEVTINPAAYTARMQPAEVYTQSYDFHSIENTALNTQIAYS